MNIPSKIIESIKLLRSIRKKIKGSETGWFKIGRGVPQGSALSSLIFAIRLAPILRRINDTQPRKERQWVENLHKEGRL